MAGPVDLSIVISTFNRCDLLPRTLDSVLSQEAPDVRYEVVVVDNNSSDATRAVLDAYTTRGHPNFRHCFEPRQGVSFGRNTGVEAAQGSVIAFTDDDLFVDRGWVAQIIRALAGHPEVDYVGGKVLPVEGTRFPRWLDRDHWSPLALFDYGDTERYVDPTDPICLGSGNSAFRREVFQRVGGFSPDFPRCQDHELQLRLWRAGSRGLYVPGIVVSTEVPPDRLTKRYHRRWHVTHGHFCALMRAEDAERSSARLFDIPGHLIRESGRDALRLLGSLPLGRLDAAFRAETRLRFSFGFARTRRTEYLRSHPTSTFGEGGRFLRALWSR